MSDTKQAEQGIMLRSLAADHGLALRHYSEKPFTLDRDHQYSSFVHRFDKPKGFWLSVKGEDDWPSWCRDEDFRTERLEVEYEVRLKSTASVLHLTSDAEIREFTDRYGKALIPEDQYGHYRSHGIDWDTVTQEYDGIIIAPYVWSARLTVTWYYSWDVASGVIWNLHAIEDLSITKA